ncbi:MAG: lipopolysaccharide biosynthesis protein [Coprobacillaceae bacterium]
MTREKSLFKNTIILAIGTFLPRVVNLLTTPILTKFMSDAEYGTINVITNMILKFIVHISSLQLEQAFFRVLIDAKTEDDKKRVINSGFAIIFLIMIALAVVALFIPVSGFGGTYKFLLIGYIWVEILCQMSRFILRAFSMYKQYSVFATLAVVVNFASVVICFYVLKMDYRGMLISLAIADIVGILYVLFSSPIFKYIKPKYYDKDVLKEMVNYALPFVPNMIAWSTNLAADQFIVTVFLGAGANGIYTAANKIPSIVSLLYPAFNLAWTESAARSVNEQGSSKYYSRMYKMIFCILSGGTALLLAASPYLFKFLINAKFIESMDYIPTLIVATYIYCFAQFFSSIYIAIKNSKNMSISTTLAAMANIVINLALVNFIGIQAAVISTLISNFLLAAYRYYDINKNYYRMRVSNRLMTLTIIILAVQMGLFWMYNPILNVVNIIIGIAYAYFICGDIVKGMLKSFLKRS